MGVGEFIVEAWLAAILLSTCLYACRYFHNRRMIGNTISLLLLVVPLVGIAGLVAFFPEVAFDYLGRNDFFSYVFVLIPMSLIGVLLFSFLEWKEAKKK